MTEKRLSGLLDEILDYAPKRDSELFLENRANQVIASANHLITMIRETYDTETADDLCKRLVRSIQSGDEEKFGRRIRAIRESKKR